MKRLREYCGEFRTRFEEHVFGVTSSILFEAACDPDPDPEQCAGIRFRFGDAGDLNAFSLETHEYGAAEKRFGFERLSQGDSLVVGERDGEVLFYAWLMIGRMDLDQGLVVPVNQDIIYSYKVFTVARSRGFRICGAYYSHVRALARARACGRLICRITPSNDASIRAHERVGFESRGRLWKITLPGQSFYVADHALRRWWSAAGPAWFGKTGVTSRSELLRLQPQHPLPV